MAKCYTCPKSAEYVVLYEHSLATQQMCLDCAGLEFLANSGIIAVVRANETLKILKDDSPVHQLELKI